MSDAAFVTGGSGFVGGALVARLVEGGRTVRALARSDDAAAALSAAGAEPVQGDLADIGSLAEGMRGCEVVFHLAGVNAMCLRDPAPLFRANVEGAAHVIGAAAQAGVRRVVHTSSAAAIGSTPANSCGNGSIPSARSLSSFARLTASSSSAIEAQPRARRRSS